MCDIKKTNRSEQPTKYLDKPELSWLIALTLVSIPPVGVYLTVRHRRNWLDKPLKILGAVAWLTVWSIYVAVDSYKPEQFTGIYTGPKIIIETNHEMVNELPSLDSEENILTNENATAPVNGQKEQDTDAGRTLPIAATTTNRTGTLKLVAIFVHVSYLNHRKSQLRLALMAVQLKMANGTICILDRHCQVIHTEEMVRLTI